MKPAREKMKEMDQEDNIRIVVAEAAHEKYVDTILETIREAAKKRGTGIAERTHEYVTTSGLIVHPDYQGHGVAKRIKDYTFTLARIRWPHAKIFSLTSGDAVMKMNTALGYVPVSFNQLTDDEAFWRGCQGCCNHNILEEKGRRFCICTGMLWDPDKHHGEPTSLETFKEVMRALVLRGIE